MKKVIEYNTPEEHIWRGHKVKKYAKRIKSNFGRYIKVWYVCNCGMEWYP